MDTNEPLLDAMDLWLDDEPHGGAWNMAVDQAWFESAERPLLRVYRWDQPTVTLGYAQNLAKLREALPTWPWVRRWTGGGVVLHNGDHTYTLMVPGGHPWAETRPVESYRQIHGSLTRALLAVGQSGCRLAQPEDVKELPFCFEAPALHDVIRGVVKVSGAGQRRGKRGLLHQGSLQQVTVGDAFWREWAARMARQVNEVERPAEAVLDRARELVEKRYDLPEWLESREDRLPGR